MRKTLERRRFTLRQEGIGKNRATKRGPAGIKPATLELEMRFGRLTDTFGPLVLLFLRTAFWPMLLCLGRELEQHPERSSGGRPDSRSGVTGGCAPLPQSTRVECGASNTHAVHR